MNISILTLLKVYMQAKANHQQNLLPVDESYSFRHEQVRIEHPESQEPWSHIWKGPSVLWVTTFDSIA